MQPLIQAYCFIHMWHKNPASKSFRGDLATYQRLSPNRCAMCLIEEDIDLGICTWAGTKKVTV